MTQRSALRHTHRTLRQVMTVARARMASGELPCGTAPLRMWGGYGSGKVCVVCGKAIERAEVEIEVEETVGGTPKLVGWFHGVCQSIWQRECARAARFSIVAEA